MARIEEIEKLAEMTDAGVELLGHGARDAGAHRRQVERRARWPFDVVDRPRASARTGPEPGGADLIGFLAFLIVTIAAVIAWLWSGHRF